MKRRPPAVSEDESALFREAVGAVDRIKPAEPTPARPRPAPRTRQRELDEQAALWESRHQPFVHADTLIGEASQHRQPGVSPRLWRQLSRGSLAVQDEIDLHSMNTVEALAALRQFVRECREHDALCVRVIHGKGLHSETGSPVLRGAVDAALRQRSDVLAFCSAPPRAGGTGALIVLLSRRRA